MENCQAICEDFERPRYHASMQRITCPGEKPCSRKAKVQFNTGKGILCLCTTHARLAREGFVAENGQVTGRNDIREYRAKMDRRPGLFRPPHTWVKGL